MADNENAINPSKFVIFCDLLCSNMIICQKSTWIGQKSVRKHEIRFKNIMVHPMWTMFMHHENVSRSITKSPYTSNLIKLLANSSLLINLHGNSGSSHACTQACAFKDANDASWTNDKWCSMYDKWNIFLMLLHEPQVLRSHVQACTSHLTPTGQNIIRD